MKRVLLALIGALVLLVALITWLGPRLLGAHVKSRLEADASDALSMQVQVGGSVALRFFPGLHVTVLDVHIRNRGLDVASIGEVHLGIELHSLLHKDLKFQSVHFKNARITIARDKSGQFNTAGPPTPASSSPAADIATVSLADSSLFYTDAKRDNDFSAENCSVEITDLRLTPTTPPDILKTVAFTGHLSCAQMHSRNLAATEVTASVAGSSGTLKFDPVVLQMFGGHGTGHVTADFTAAEPVYHVHSTISKLQIADFSKAVTAGAVTPEKIAAGALDFSANLTMHGTPETGVMGTVAGEASLHGHDLVLNIGDLDKEFSNYESTQSFNLIDVGAFFLAGPLGVAAVSYTHLDVYKRQAGA